MKKIIIFFIILCSCSRVKHSLVSNSESQILTFSIIVNGTNYNGLIDELNKTIKVRGLPHGTNLNKLIAYFSFSTNSNVFVNGVSQISGISIMDFSSKVTYTVTSENKFSTSSYTVQVTTSSITYAYIVGKTKITVCTVGETGNLSNCLIAASSGFTNLSTMTIYNNYAYIVDDFANKIFKCLINLDGKLTGCNSEITGTGNPFFGIAANNGYLYISSTDTSTLTICNIDSTGSLTGCSTTGSGFSDLSDLTIYGNYLFATDNGASDVVVCSIGLSGLLSSCFTTPSGIASPESIAVYNSFSYISSFIANNVYFCSVSATGIFSNCKISGSGLNHVLNFYYYNNYIYALESASSNVFKCEISGTGDLTNCSIAGSGFASPQAIYITTQ
ncbi:hypothetical protein GCL60_01480 [Silvanigrella paludirubra]|uniref:YncE family protein n=1 Tax=Silvanigrella paludirubra TaxID=2499159 RepID=A0A6N6VVL7_9BACT|nr:hypothetical protein [Silvanigrella paludirubra]KAB8040620.1 hypothetical protein GCL60_01480 [Silvanigrella paludirubra]